MADTSTRAVELIRKPSYVLLCVSGLIFCAEFLAMILLMHLPHIKSYQEALLDALLLTLAVFPVLYFLIFVPLRAHIDLRRQAENEKDSLIIELRKAIDEVDTLRGFIPICASCKQIRDDEGYWHQVEAYISSRSNAKFSHGICPTCAKKLYPDLYPDIVKDL